MDNYGGFDGDITRDFIRSHISKWAAGGKEGYKEKLEAALEALIYISENEERRHQYEKMMDDDWLEAFLIMHYYAIVGTGMATKLKLSDGPYGSRRAISASHDEDGEKHVYDLFLVDPQDIREIARRAIIVAMYYMDERTKVERLLENDTND